MGRVPVFHSSEKIATILSAPSKALDLSAETHVRFEEAWQYESQFRHCQDPWGYCTRAGEVLKYKTLAHLCLTHSKDSLRRIADIGCGLGWLAKDLAAKGARVTAMDLSPAAVLRADRSLPPDALEPVFAAGSVTAIPLANDSIDLMVIADGLFTWGFDEATCEEILRQAAATLVPGGKILLMDYLKVGDQASFMRIARSGDLRVTRILPLHDRPWYAVELLLRPLRHQLWCQRLLSNLNLARMLSLVGRVLGRFGSAHICVVAEKGMPPAP